jgi:hypothetical protein
MFGDVVESSIKFGNKQGYSVALTFALEVVVVALVVIIPLMAADVLPTPPSMLAFVAAAPPPPPPPPPRRRRLRFRRRSRWRSIPTPRQLRRRRKSRPEVPQDTNFDRAVGVEGGIPGRRSRRRCRRTT